MPVRTIDASSENYTFNCITDSYPEINPNSPYEDYFGSVCYVKDILAPKQTRLKIPRDICRL